MLPLVGDAEVVDLVDRTSITSHQNVLRFNILMRNAMCVQTLQSCQRLQGQIESGLRLAVQ
jgi:hypothetical protein